MARRTRRSVRIIASDPNRVTSPGAPYFVRVKSLWVAGVVLALTLTACGGDDKDDDGGGSRPSVTEIAKALQDSGFVKMVKDENAADAAAACIAQAYYDSGVSDKALQQLVDTGGIADATADDDAAVVAISSEITGCLKDADKPNQEESGTA